MPQAKEKVGHDHQNTTKTKTNNRKITSTYSDTHYLLCWGERDANKNICM